MPRVLQHCTASMATHHFDREVLGCEIEKGRMAEIHEIVLVHVAESNHPSAGGRDERKIAVDLPAATVPGDVGNAVGVALMKSGVKYQFGLRRRHDTKTEKSRHRQEDRTRPIEACPHHFRSPSKEA